MLGRGFLRSNTHAEGSPVFFVQSIRITITLFMCIPLPCGRTRRVVPQQLNLKLVYASGIWKAQLMVAITMCAYWISTLKVSVASPTAT